MQKFPRILLILFFCVYTGNLFCQYELDYGFTAGASNYLGEIGGRKKTRRDFVSDLKFAKTRWATGGFIRYRYRRNVSFKGSLDYLRLQGDDKLTVNVGRRYRNANFKNDLFSVSAVTQISFFQNNNMRLNKHYRWEINWYVFGGVGCFYHNPKTLYNGSWVKLRPLQTEGYKYSRFVMSLPTGIGFDLIRRSKDRFGLELSWVKTFTDYIDDISGNYPDSPPENAMTQALSVRSDELPQELKDKNPGAYLSHTWGNKRGDPTHKDNYITLTAHYSHAIKGKRKARYSQRGLFKSRSTRKIRARF